MPGIGQSATKSNFVVYKLTNKINGKAYIGISNRCEHIRWSEHKERARQGIRNSRLYNAIRKYGPDAFTLERLAMASSEDELRQLERGYIEKFNTFGCGYNSNPGGHGFLKFPEHIKIKISEAQKGKIIPPESRERMSQAKLGDGRCAANFGEHTKKGNLNPRSRSYRFRFPDGSERIVTGLRAFCRDHGLSMRHVKGRKQTKGYSLLERLND